MRPVRLFLEGFGSYRQATDIDFTDVGFFALVGATGSGKSMVIDGLCFALYGTVPRWGRENAIAHALPPSANSCRVCLVFETGMDRYAAVRLLARDNRGRVHTKEARLDRLDPGVPPDGDLSALLEAVVEPVAEGDNVTDAVANLLGLTYQHFTQCVLLPQGRFAEFLQAKPSDRQDLLVELLAFGVYEQIGQLARQRAQLGEERRKVLQSQRDDLAGATEEAEQRAKERVAGLAGLTEAIDAQMGRHEAARSHVKEAEAAASANSQAVDQLDRVAIPAGADNLAARVGAADAKVGEARASRERVDREAESARDARERFGEVEPLRRWREAYTGRGNAEASLAEQRRTLESRANDEGDAMVQVAAAEKSLEAAEAAERGARAANAAAAIASILKVGDPCPVCGQVVAELPHAEPPADLMAAAADLNTAKERHRQAAKTAQDVALQVAAARHGVEAAEAQVERHVADLEGAPEETALDAALAAIETADASLRMAAEQARVAQRELLAAEGERKGLEGAEREARAQLNRTRDTLVPLGPPQLDGADLAADWQALSRWARRERDRRAGEQVALDAIEAAARGNVAEVEALVRAMLGEYEVEATDVGTATVDVARARTRAEADLESVQADRRRAAGLDKQLQALDEEVTVARSLGEYLRSNQFERWLCGEALDSLVIEASHTLKELSSGQYELDLNDRNEFFVIDYDDAGTRRPVHTLSGGETFQASLALALALSRQVVDLSGGKRDLDSMFLDEGFGTLDENTLDTVASTLERLASDRDRMVGVVTHVAALAERVPVQFVVTRDATSSHISKKQMG
jgi:DNA repair protein SbcC/Rad50